MAETDSAPGFHPEGPQGKIDADLGIANCDILVAIFWTKFGSPVEILCHYYAPLL